VEIFLGIVGVAIAAGGLWWQIEQKRRQERTTVRLQWEQAEVRGGTFVGKVRVRNLGKRTEYIESAEVKVGLGYQRIEPTVREVPPQGSALLEFKVAGGGLPRLGALFHVTFSNGYVAHAGPPHKLF
jgi:hypothetical protein